MVFQSADFKHSKGLLFHGGAVAYASSAYLLGFRGLFSEAWSVNVGATLLIAHGMTIAAYMVHECGHQLVFESNGDTGAMQDMEAEERAIFIEQKSKKRDEVQGRIQALAEQRRDYIQEERSRLADNDAKGLDEVIQEGLQALAEEKGFTFSESE